MEGKGKDEHYCYFFCAFMGVGVHSNLSLKASALCTHFSGRIVHPMLIMHVHAAPRVCVAVSIAEYAPGKNCVRKLYSTSGYGEDTSTPPLGAVCRAH